MRRRQSRFRPDKQALLSTIYQRIIEVSYSLTLTNRDGATTPLRDEISRGHRRSEARGASRSERNVVVHVAVAGGARRNRAARCAGRTARAEVGATGLVRSKAASASAAAIEHGQGRVEALQHDLGRIFLDPALVGPFARLQRALDVHLGALLQILLGDLAEPFVEDDDAVPLGLFLALAGGLVAPGFRRRNAQIGDRPAILRPPDFRILAEIADQNHLVHASRHRRSPLKKSLAKITWLAAHRPPHSVAAHHLGRC